MTRSRPQLAVKDAVARDRIRRQVSRCETDPGSQGIVAAPQSAVVLPLFALVVRGLPAGVHPYLNLLPRILESPAMRRIGRGRLAATDLAAGALVRVSAEPGFAYLDDDAREIVLAQAYYATGSSLDLYLDLLHELTHLRQLIEGLDVWDESYSYPERPTEIEAYAVAVEEGRRLGMSEAELFEHLASPCLSASDVRELYADVQRFLAAGATKDPLPNRRGKPRGDVPAGRRE